MTTSTGPCSRIALLALLAGACGEDGGSSNADSSSGSVESSGPAEESDATSETPSTTGSAGEESSSSAEGTDAADGGSSSDSGEDLCEALRLVDGAPDDVHDFSVGICQADLASDCSADVGNCSGTLIAPNLVLTARHCLDHGLQISPNFCTAEFTEAYSLHFVTTHPDPYNVDDEVWYGVDEVLVPEGGNTLCTWDIAVAILDQNVPSEEATPASVDLDTDYVETPPCAAAIVGRGAIEVDLTEAPGGSPYPEVVDNGDHRRRLMQNIPVLCISDEDGACTIEDSSDPAGEFVCEPAQMLLGPASLPGDSGAGVLEQTSFTQGDPQVVAVAHAGTFGFDEQPNGTLAIRVSVHRDFLIEAAQQASIAGGYPLPSWAE